MSNNTIAVTAGIYKLEQNMETKGLTFYVFHNVVKTMEADHIYSMQELFDIMCDCCVEYKNEEQNDGSR